MIATGSKNVVTRPVTRADGNYREGKIYLVCAPLRKLFPKLALVFMPVIEYLSCNKKIIVLLTPEGSFSYSNYREKRSSYIISTLGDNIMFTRMTKAVGPKGNYLGLCRSIGRVPFPISVPIFGKVATIPEILNIHDNFAVGELRDSYIEAVLSKAVSPVVVDCGVNVGVTVRWWFHLNPSCRVFGLDMMQEAHDLTNQRLKGKDAAYIGITAALSSRDGEEVTIYFNDPLEGMNCIGSKNGATSRTLITARIDSLLAPHSLSRIELLKIDIEGYAAKALAGAGRTLSFTQNVILETHSEDELGESEAILVASGFRLRHFRNRNLWFKRA
jgi:FkbM family methyltransferase